MDKTEKVLRKIEQLGEEVFLPVIGRKKGAFLESLIKKYQPKMILEIGSLVGYSAILMARNLKKDSKIISIEFVPEIANAAREHIKEAGFSDIINVVEGNAIDIIPALEVAFDFIFIDASKDEYFSYLKLLESGRIGRGCVILADNVKIFADSMEDYLEYVRKSGKYKSKYYDFGDDGMEVSIVA